jgi:hypothetical protein
MRGRDLGLLLLLGASFGSSFLFIRVAAPEFGPAPLMAVRLALAAVVLFAYARARGHAVAFAGDRARWWLMGIFNAALPFTLIAWAELRITSSLAAVLIATMPLFTSLVSAVWTKTALGGPQRVGLALGLVGVLVLSGGGSIDLGVRGVLPILALLTASLSYAVGNVFVKQRFAGVPRLTLTIGNFAAAGARRGARSSSASRSRPRGRSQPSSMRVGRSTLSIGAIRSTLPQRPPLPISRPSSRAAFRRALARAASGSVVPRARPARAPASAPCRGRRRRRGGARTAPRAAPAGARPATSAFSHRRWRSMYVSVA